MLDADEAGTMLHPHHEKEVRRMATVTFKAVSRKLPEGLAVENTVRGFTAILDEPQASGGTDKGMNPVEAALAALGSCQCITAAAFAKQQGIDLKDFWVELEGDLNTDGFRHKDPAVRPGFQEVRFTMHIKTDAAPEKVAAFQEFIEATCPVGDSLGKGVSLKPARILIEH